MRKNTRKSAAKTALARQPEGIDVLAELAALKAMTVPELQGKWRVMFGEPAPNASRGNLELRIGYRIQELAHGGIKPATRRTLDALAAELASGAPGPLIADPRRPIPGTKLMRELQGEEQVVTVLTDGFEWQGRRFKSLSAAVRAITGSHWNGWKFFGLARVALRDRYDDGGFSGGTLDRPALQQLITDIEAGLIDVVVVYKIDRLSRALMDFSKLVEIFDRHGVTFVSVTQSFNTTTSMGRLTLNILLSFAQFEREVIGERIRDKFAASRRKGMWMGGPVPLGYVVKDRKLVIEPAEAEQVRTIFRLYARSSSTAQVLKELHTRGIRTKRGAVFDRGYLLKFLHNKVYLGIAVHKGEEYPGEHKAIIDRKLWDEVHDVIANNRVARGAVARAAQPALLRGLIFTETGAAMTPHHTKRKGKRYCYYTSMDVIRKRPAAELRGPQRLPGAMIEDAVIGEIRRMLRTPEVAARTARAVRKDRPDLDETTVVAALAQFDDLWKALIPAEQARIVQLLVARITVSEAGLAIDLRHDGLGAIAALIAPPKKEVA